MVLIIIIITIIIAVIVYSTQKENREEVNYEILTAVRSRYKLLKVIITSSYALKVCPKCYENHMDLLTVSPAGQSIEYKCINCNKKLTSKLLPNKDSTEAVKLFNEIKGKLTLLEGPLSNELYHEDAYSDFHVNIGSENDNRLEHRQVITEEVRHEVWRRDQGKCVSCGSQQKLEFDHIIPFSKGGSNTARNIQLLCESCNRSKHSKI